MGLDTSPANTTALPGFNLWDFHASENLGRESSRATWEFYCLWTDRTAIAFKLLGGAAIVGGQIVVAGPARHPDYPYLAVTNVGIDQKAGRDGLTLGPNNMVATRYAKVECEFTSLDPQDRGEERIDFSSCVITCPDGTFGYGAGTNRRLLRSAEAPGYRIPAAQFTRTINSLPQIPVPTILSLIGKVNGTAGNNLPQQFIGQPPGYFLGAAPGTLLLVGASSQRWFTSQGVKQWNITYSFEWRQVPHNRFLIPAFGARPSSWQDITDNLGNPPYADGDFTTLGITQ
jgi:hypothetical protein